MGFFEVIFIGQASLVAAQETVSIGANHPADVVHLLPGAIPLALDRQLNMEVTFALRNRPGLDRLLKSLQDPSSPYYRHWLMRDEFDRRFAPTKERIEAVRQWLVDQSFTIRSVNQRARYIAFSGTVAQAQTAFGVSIVARSDGRLFANTADPVVPARFAGTISAIRGLDNLIESRPAYSPQASPSAIDSMKPLDNTGDLPAYNANGAGPDAFGAQDIWSFYDELPLLSLHTDGSGTD